VHEAIGPGTIGFHLQVGFL